MSASSSASRGRSFGARGSQAGKAIAKPVSRPKTYAELSIPGADEAPPPVETIWKRIDSFWLRMKWQLVLIGIGITFITLQGWLFSFFESPIAAGEKEIGRELRALAAQCQDPAARKRLEDAGWSVRADAKGACRLERRPK